MPPIEKLVANVVLRPSTSDFAAVAPVVSPDVVAAIANEMSRPQVRDPGSLGTGQPIKLISARDQVSIDLQDVRVAIEDESTDVPFSSRFWGLVQHVTTVLQSGFEPFGYNFQAAIDHPNMASGAVISRLLKASTLSADIERPIEFSAVTLHADSTTSDGIPYRWTAKIEPRFEDATSDKTYIEANAHFDMPFDMEFVRTHADEIYEEFTAIALQLLQEGEDHA